jgi:hypothetical protein
LARVIPGPFLFCFPSGVLRVSLCLHLPRIERNESSSITNIHPEGDGFCDMLTPLGRAAGLCTRPGPTTDARATGLAFKCSEHATQRQTLTNSTS